MSDKKSTANVPKFLQANQESGSMLFPDEPRGMFNETALDKLLVWATEAGASDITIQTDEQVFIETGSGMHRITRKVWSNDEVLNGLAHMFGNQSIKGRMQDIRDADFAYDLAPSRDYRFRFRVNAVGIVVRGKPGVQITLRTIPSLPPKMSDLGLEPDIVNNICPRQGIILVTGATGSGKSTLLASIIRDLCEDPNGNRKIITFESPIEFVYDEIVKPTTSIAQSEIGRNLESFVAATRNALRRKPVIILLGEARDAETIGEAILTAMTGHLIFTTVHTNGFPDTIRRMVSVFPEGERNARAVDLISALKMVVSQTLVPGKKGGRVALREFLVMTPEIVETLLESDLDKLSLTCRKVLSDHGQSFLQAAQRAYAQEKITKEVLARFEHTDRAEQKDAEDLAKDHRHPIGATENERAPAGSVNLDDPQQSSGSADTRLDDLNF